MLHTEEQNRIVHILHTTTTRSLLVPNAPKQTLRTVALNPDEVTFVARFIAALTLSNLLGSMRLTGFGAHLYEKLA